MYVRVLLCSSILYILLLTFYCIVNYHTLSFGCCDEKISPFVGQIKEIMIMIMIQFSSKEALVIITAATGGRQVVV